MFRLFIIPQQLANQIADSELIFNRSVLTHSLRLMFLNFSFVYQNISACLKLNRPRLVIVYCSIRLLKIKHPKTLTIQYILPFLSESQFSIWHGDEMNKQKRAEKYCQPSFRWYRTQPVQNMIFLSIHTLYNVCAVTWGIL